MMLEKIGKAAKQASWYLAGLNTKQKNNVLMDIADCLQQQSDAILAANAQDIEAAKAGHMNAAMQDRLFISNC